MRIKGKHNPKNRVGAQVFCWSDDGKTSFPVELISYDNNKYITAKRSDTGEVVSSSRSYFFRKMINDPTIHRGIGLAERFVLGGGKREDFKKRQRSTEWRVGQSARLGNKRDAIRIALSLAQKSQEVIEFSSSLHTRRFYSFGHTQVEVHPIGHVVQYGGSVSRSRSGQPKYVRGHGKLFTGVPRSLSMRQRRARAHS
jgi:hypothetical protein